MDQTPGESLSAAKAAIGGSRRLARELVAKGIKITPQAISQWERVPVDKVLMVEEVTGVSRHDLRPDIYPRETRRRA